MDKATRPYLAMSRAIARLPGLPPLLGAPVQRAPSRSNTVIARAVLGWGKKPSSIDAERYATRVGIPLLRIEDGFLRSVGLGNESPPLSIVVDDLGIYYDASSPSRIEALVGRELRPEEMQRAVALMLRWRAARVSKYNRSRELDPLPDPGFVLVIDQTFGDASIRFGQATESSFLQMLEAAIAENADREIVLKVHPDVFAGRKKGHFDQLPSNLAKRVRILGEDTHPVGLLERAAAVYTVTSQVGFEALLWGKPVRCFGMPFYAGWGLTQDALPPPARRHPVKLENLIHGALIDYARYIDPETGAACEPERLIDWMGLQRRMRERLPRVVEATGFSAWKRPIVRSFLQGTSVRFSRHGDATGQRQEVPRVVWGCGQAGGYDKGRMIHLEDGFLRSVGLGADLVRPVSWVVDPVGIYYDATRPSGLERILRDGDWDEAALKRARELKARIVASKITKYNVTGAPWRRPAHAGKVILVPGQVESDASIAFGAPQLRRNMDLLRAVREHNPDAWIVYKPHPDVVAGLRRKGLSEEAALDYGDEVVLDSPMGELLVEVDEVHVLTSLAGFEALMRGKRVHCYGMPFYAGWGLTVDHLACPRRDRTLSLDQLVAGTLIDYPTYISRTTGAYTTPERALDELLDWRLTTRGNLPWWRKPLRFILGLRRR